MTISFQNPGEIDLTALQVMGLSGKPDAATAIGRFGTGLKYAIAITLRLGGNITIWRGTAKFTFKAYNISFRGKQTTRVTCIAADGSETPLPFTLEYGQDWKPWQALRELESNVRDEGGSSAAIAHQPKAGTTTIWVDCPDIEAEYSKLNSIFLQSIPLFKPHTNSYPEIHPKTTFTSNHIYYRGVQVSQCMKPNMFTYNFRAGISLTEDRTVAAGTVPLMEWYIVQAFHYCEDRSIIEKVLTAPLDSFEDSISWNDIVYVEDRLFWKVVEEFVNNGLGHQIAPTLVAKYYQGSGREEELYQDYPLSQREVEMKNHALRILKRYNVPPLRFVSSLPKKALGMAFKGKVYIASRCFSMGLETLVGTIFEETAHHNEGHVDETRSFQNYLMDTVAKLLVDLDYERNNK